MAFFINVLHFYNIYSGETVYCTAFKMNDLTSFVGHNSIGVFPSILSASKLPLFSIKSNAQSPCPSSHALCKGVLP